MKISEGKKMMTAIFSYNLDQLSAGKDHDTFVVPMFEGDPGVGKTSIPKQVAKALGVDYYQSIVAQYDAGEMAGIPIIVNDEIHTLDEKTGKEVTEKHSKMVRLRPDYLPPVNCDHAIFNLDEMPQAPLSNQNICSQIVNEYRVGHHPVGQGIAMCCTGNKPGNKAGTTNMPSHLKDRLTFITIEPDLDETLRYFSQQGVSPMVRSYLANNPSALHDFNPTATASPTPRSWEKTSAILSLDLERKYQEGMINGQIGEGHGVKFKAWLRLEDKLPKLQEILDNPDKAKVFGAEDADVLYLLLANLADVANKGNIGKILTYITRMPNKEFLAYFATDCFSRDKELLEVREVSNWKMKHLSQLIF